jgi:hypothetical protein
MKENYNIQQLHFLVVDDNKHMSMLFKICSMRWARGWWPRPTTPPMRLPN